MSVVSCQLQKTRGGDCEGVGFHGGASAGAVNCKLCDVCSELWDGEERGDLAVAGSRVLVPARTEPRLPKYNFPDSRDHAGSFSGLSGVDSERARWPESWLRMTSQTDLPKFISWLIIRRFVGSGSGQNSGYGVYLHRGNRARCGAADRLGLAISAVHVLECQPCNRITRSSRMPTSSVSSGTPLSTNPP